MKHRQFSFLLVLSFLFSLIGCGPKSKISDSNFNLGLQRTLSFFESEGPRSGPAEPPYYMVLTLQNTSLNPFKGTRVIVAGEGHSGGEGAVFQESAVTLALKYQDAFPNEQVLLFFAIQDSVAKELKIIQDWKLQVVAFGNEELGVEEWLRQLQPYRSIKAIHLFSHSWKDYSIIQGMDALSTFSDLTILQERLSPDSYMVIHGCNAGWVLAPNLAQSLHIPVAGALTSTNFEQLHSAGNFYFNDEVTKPEGPWAARNPYSFSQSQACYRGACVRMRPDNHPYNGVHGKFEQGLPFYKFFCPEDAIEVCERTMAGALLGFPDLKPLKLSSSEEDFKSAARDWLCPIRKNSMVRDACIKALTNAEKSSSPENDQYSPFLGKMLKCDFFSCWNSSSDEPSDALVLEYRAYLKGIRKLLSNRP